MAVRPTMQYLIDYVRELILDNEPDPQFTDQQIQDRLDLNRLDVYMDQLRPAETLATTGYIEWHDFYSVNHFWEEGAVLQIPGGTIKTPDDANYLIGRWHFNTKQQVLPVFITGVCYDVYGTCAKLLFQIEAKMRNQFNFTADGLTVQRIAQVKDIHDMALTYQAQGWGAAGGATTMRVVRKDMR